MTPGADLLLAGGEVLDPGGRSGRLDVAITGGRISAVGERLDRAAAREVIDVDGRLVLPGLVDLHTHVFPGVSYWGIDPDPIAWRSGVTTWVDAGSAGAFTMDAFAETARRFTVRTAALINVSSIGLTGETGENVQIANDDVDAAITAGIRHRGLVRGVKVRMDRNAVGDSGIEPVRRGIAVAEALGLPVMVHISYPPPGLDEYVHLLRPGDIVTHCASECAHAGAPRGGISDAVRAAVDGGIVFDIGHGSGGFAFEVLDAQLAAGIRPHTISTDLHARSVLGPAFDLPTTMMKFLACGFSLADVVTACTRAPAAVLGLDAGTLDVGAPADVAVFDAIDEPTPVSDAHRVVRTAPLRLVNALTLVAGRPMPPQLPAAPGSWVPLSAAQRRALAQRDFELRRLLTTPLVGPEGLDEQFHPDEAGAALDRNDQ